MQIGSVQKKKKMKTVLLNAPVLTILVFSFFPDCDWRNGDPGGVGRRQDAHDDFRRRSQIVRERHRRFAPTQNFHVVLAK